jgi:branched-chain amino acid transport system substrate-binding protein
MWTQQLGATLSLFDAGAATLTASAEPSNKPAVAKAMSTLKTVTIAGPVDFNTGPVPNVSPGPIIGCQWVKAPSGSRFPLEFPVTENATDPNVPIQAKLRPYNS